MDKLIFIDDILTYRGQNLYCGESYIEGDAVVINLKNDDNDFYAILVANETIINGVLQTSADMIIQTLSA